LERSWSDVYSYLDKFGLGAPGGRIGPVGVPGLLLAGGVHFYGNQIGWACDNVVGYEIVLADGSLVEVSKTNHHDLFWALKGGSSNFGLVTRFDIETVRSPKVWAGTHTVSAKYIDQFLEVSARYGGLLFGY
jgi:FAD/FMN-containing dehydrogenase